MGSSHVAWVPPDSFDEYRLVKALGRGSMGQVWLAHDTVLDRLVAVKFVAGLPDHDATRQRFLTEARAAARVQHPNIIAIYRVGEIGPRPYLISEYVRGDSLDKIARPVAWPRLLEIAIGLARGLAAAHSQGVVHRDLKPANAIVAATGEVKLLDFGLAKLLPHIVPPHAGAPSSHGATVTLPGAPGESTSWPHTISESEVAIGGSITLPEGTPTGMPRAREPRVPNPAIDPWPSVTHTGAVIGTPAYMSPEAWRGEPSTLRSDVYSLGALLYALGAGAPPHRSDSLEVAQEAALACGAPSLTVAVPGIDARFAAIVDRCLRRDPAERFAYGHDVREALEALVAGDAPAARVLAQAPHVRPALHPRRVILGIVLALVLALVLAFFAYPNVGGEPSRHPVHAAPATDARPEARAPRSPDAPALTAIARSAGAVPGGCPEGMVPVPAGTFQMGSPEGEGDADEHPQHEVTLPPYCIDRTEVTVAAYAECVAAGGCRAALHTVNWKGYVGNNVKLYSGWCNREDRPYHPINCIDWDQAAVYCAWKNQRLPTEAEWEYAARGGGGLKYSWGDEAPSAKRLNACDHECVAMMVRHMIAWGSHMTDGDDGWETTAPVGSYPGARSPFGALDMAGNVWEWTADWYGAYTTQAQTNPQGPSTGTSRVFRGGGWASIQVSKARTADRSWNTPTTRDCDLGFRCARGQ